MIPTKAYILRIDTDISREYAKLCAESCDRVGLPWEYFEGYTENSVNTSTFVIKTDKRLQQGAARIQKFVRVEKIEVTGVQRIKRRLKTERLLLKPQKRRLGSGILAGQPFD